VAVTALLGRSLALYSSEECVEGVFSEVSRPLSSLLYNGRNRSGEERE
jgi:hypothetical protein